MCNLISGVFWKFIYLVFLMSFKNQYLYSIKKFLLLATKLIIKIPDLLLVNIKFLALTSLDCKIDKIYIAASGRLIDRKFCFEH